MSKYKHNTTRRDLLAGVGFFAGLAVAPSALAMNAQEAEWEKIAEQAQNWHPERGRKVVRLARAAGMDPFSWSGMAFCRGGSRADPENFPQLYFETGGSTWRVTPRGCRRLG